MNVAYLNRGLKLTFTNEYTGETKVFEETEGIKSFVGYLNREVNKLHSEPIYLEGKSGDIEVEIAFQYTDK